MARPWFPLFNLRYQFNLVGIEYRGLRYFGRLPASLSRNVLRIVNT
jgi:hypothetical protein